MIDLGIYRDGERNRVGFRSDLSGAGEVCGSFHVRQLNDVLSGFCDEHSPCLPRTCNDLRERYFGA